ncbi:hypothetical protein Nepgr_033117 [Nepenthes gracilis]|uniref:Uncharacterized protein n=1 Tax=Nepenthes gracilis TaxID=150966 RepID=A0AAD3Y8F4_NEPGR|nr:hypothetical protein Nepgr_033117 [Nepenthes gracilis]
MSVVELTIAIHYVFHAPVDKYCGIWGSKRLLLETQSQNDGLPSYTSRCESEYDSFGAAQAAIAYQLDLAWQLLEISKGNESI